MMVRLTSKQSNHPVWIAADRIIAVIDHPDGTRVIADDDGSNAWIVLESALYVADVVDAARKPADAGREEGA